MHRRAMSESIAQRGMDGWEWTARMMDKRRGTGLGSDGQLLGDDGQRLEDDVRIGGGCVGACWGVMGSCRGTMDDGRGATVGGTLGNDEVRRDRQKATVAGLQHCPPRSPPHLFSSSAG
eukprot:362251-Chlamydomonas_euryale.AAC.1